MIGPINEGSNLNPIIGEMNRSGKDLDVIGKLQVGDKLVVVQDATGPKLDVSKKGPLQGTVRTLQNIFSSTKAKVEDTVTYIHQLNERTFQNIVSLSELTNVPNLTKEQLEKAIQTLKILNQQTSTAVEGLTNLSKTYKSDDFKGEKEQLEMTMRAGESVYQELNRQLQQKKLNEQQIRPLLMELEALDIPVTEQMNLSEAEADNLKAKREEFQTMLYEIPPKAGDKEVIESVRTAASEGQFKNDLHRWRSFKLNGTELYTKGERNVEDLANKQIYPAFPVKVAHLITQTNFKTANQFVVDAYKESNSTHHILGGETYIHLYSNPDGEVHLKMIIIFPIAIEEPGKDPEYVFSKIAKREIIIPKNGEDFDNMRVIDAYSKEIPSQQLARELMKFA